MLLKEMWAVWSLLPYGSETWSRRRAEQKKFEMWVWRKVEGITEDKITNEAVLIRVGETKTLLDTIRTRKKLWLGHALRHSSLAKLAIESKVAGKRARGRRIAILDDVKNGESYALLKKGALGRRVWRGKLAVL